MKALIEIFYGLTFFGAFILGVYKLLCYILGTA